jgi:hypothetical protein
MHTPLNVSFPPPTGFKEIEARYGKFKFVPLSKGAIDIDDTWERDNIVMLRNVCGTKCNIQLHRLMAPLFEHCLGIALARTKYKVRMLGGFVPRHMRHDPKFPLSIHSWGAAFDVNWDTNPMTSKLVTDLPTGFISAFTDNGWEWGGAWRSVKDAMHFQYAKGV